MLANLSCDDVRVVVVTSSRFPVFTWLLGGNRLRQEIAMLREQLRLRNQHIQQQRQELSDEKVPGDLANWKGP